MVRYEFVSSYRQTYRKQCISAHHANAQVGSVTMNLVIFAYQAGEFFPIFFYHPEFSVIFHGLRGVQNPLKIGKTKWVFDLVESCNIFIWGLHSRGLTFQLAFFLGLLTGIYSQCTLSRG